MWRYRGFIIVNHQDIGYYAIYRETATAFNVVQAINLFTNKDFCYKHIDRILDGYFNDYPNNMRM